ncbi:MAG TPA: DNA polymerase III subunit delta [Gaiellaceae bacterium]|nr:DNA polymerase III subunit delta [Gaiellaceae bacterium]
MSREPLLPVYLLNGTDGSKVRRALSRLRARIGNETLELLDASDTSGTAAVEACNAMGLFGSEADRLVVVEGVERWKPEDAQAIAAYLLDPAPGSILALVTAEPPKTSTLADALKKGGKVLAFDIPKPRDLPGWVRAQLEGLHLQLDGESVRALIEIVGDDPTALTTELEKISAWAGTEPVSRRDVEQLAVSANEPPGWALADAWGSRNVQATLEVCEAALENNDPFVVAMKLTGQVELVRVVQVFAEEGLPTKEIAKKVRRHEFRVRKALDHSRNYSREELDDAIVRLADLDEALKGASRLAGELELIRAVVDVTRTSELAHH